jgi:hypothetical protein
MRHRPLPPRPTAPCRRPLTWRRSRCGGLAALLICGLAACTPLPEPATPLSEAERSAPVPALVPAETLLAGIPADAITPASEQSLANRVAALEARAETLRHTGLEPETRSRMQAGVPLEAVTAAP